TSITTLITIVLLYFMGATALKDFALPIIIGVICGSYTSIFVAAPTAFLCLKKTAKK
ncbi:MAG: hypothetical protein J6Q75_03385, partial [Bacteroidaceae bacterium]|nr:hypothetical protein [Bacteroidaceae bacterium]